LGGLINPGDGFKLLRFLGGGGGGKKSDSRMKKIRGKRYRSRKTLREKNIEGPSLLPLCRGYSLLSGKGSETNEKAGGVDCAGAVLTQSVVRSSGDGVKSRTGQSQTLKAHDVFETETTQKTPPQNQKSNLEKKHVRPKKGHNHKDNHREKR